MNAHAESDRKQKPKKKLKNFVITQNVLKCEHHDFAEMEAYEQSDFNKLKLIEIILSNMSLQYPNKELLLTCTHNGKMNSYH